MVVVVVVVVDFSVLRVIQSVQIVEVLVEVAVLVTLE